MHPPNKTPDCGMDENWATLLTFINITATGQGAIAEWMLAYGN